MSTVRTTITLPSDLAEELKPFRKAGELNVSGVCAQALRSFLRGDDERTPLEHYTLGELADEIRRRADNISGSQ